MASKLEHTYRDLLSTLMRDTLNVIFLHILNRANVSGLFVTLIQACNHNLMIGPSSMASMSQQRENDLGSLKQDDGSIVKHSKSYTMLMHVL